MYRTISKKSIRIENRTRSKNRYVSKIEPYRKSRYVNFQKWSSTALFRKLTANFNNFLIRPQIFIIDPVNLTANIENFMVWPQFLEYWLQIWEFYDETANFRSNLVFISPLLDPIRSNTVINIVIGLANDNKHNKHKLTYYFRNLYWLQSSKFMAPPKRLWTIN